MRVIPVVALPPAYTNRNRGPQMPGGALFLTRAVAGGGELGGPLTSNSPQRPNPNPVVQTLKKNTLVRLLPPPPPLPPLHPCLKGPRVASHWGSQAQAHLTHLWGGHTPPSAGVPVPMAGQATQPATRLSARAGGAGAGGGQVSALSKAATQFGTGTPGLADCKVGTAGGRVSGACL